MSNYYYHQLPSGRAVLVSPSYDPTRPQPIFWYIYLTWETSKKNYPLLTDVNMIHELDRKFWSQEDKERGTVLWRYSFYICYYSYTYRGNSFIISINSLNELNIMWKKQPASRSWLDAAPPLDDLRLEAIVLKELSSRRQLQGYCAVYDIAYSVLEIGEIDYGFNLL